MIYDFNNIPQELLDGTTAEELAQAFSNKLNEATKNLSDQRMEMFKKMLTEAAECYNTAIEYYFAEYRLPEGTSIDNFYIDMHVLAGILGLTIGAAELLNTVDDREALIDKILDAQMPFN